MQMLRSQDYFPVPPHEWISLISHNSQGDFTCAPEHTFVAHQALEEDTNGNTLVLRTQKLPVYTQKQWIYN